MEFEKTLGYLVGDEDCSRVELVQVGKAGQTPTLEIRMQRHAGDLGWLTHKRIRMASGQIGHLRDALNLMDINARETTRANVLPSPRHEDDSNILPFPGLLKTS